MFVKVIANQSSVVFVTRCSISSMYLGVVDVKCVRIMLYMSSIAVKWRGGSRYCNSRA